ncbi:MAG: hypothetical protein U1G05_01495 [Kiritimatiellia bacterium]
MGVLRAWCLRNRLPLAVVAGCWLLRLALIALGGQFCWPDEWRYYRGVEWLNRMLHGEFREPLRENLGQAGHVGFILASLLPAAAQGVVRAVTGLHPEDTLALPAAWYALFSAAIPGLVYALMLRSGGDRREAALAMLFAASSTALLHYSRHLFPYDLSMFLWLLALWLGSGARPPRAPRMPAAAGRRRLHRLQRLLARRGPRPRGCTSCGGPVPLPGPRGARWPPSPAWSPCRSSSPSPAGSLGFLPGRAADPLRVAHRRPLRGGRGRHPGCTWGTTRPCSRPCGRAGALLALRVPRARMWVGRLRGLRRPRARRAKFVVSAGWPARSSPLCLAAAGMVPRAGARPGPAVALLALMAVQTAVNWRPVFTQTFPDDFFHAAEARVGRANLQVGLTVAGPDVRDEPDLLRPARYVVVNACLLKPVNGALAPPPGRTLMEAVHPQQRPQNWYDGMWPHERDILRHPEHRMRLIDTQPDTPETP